MVLGLAACGGGGKSITVEEYAQRLDRLNIYYDLGRVSQEKVIEIHRDSFDPKCSEAQFNINAAVAPGILFYSDIAKCPNSKDAIINAYGLKVVAPEDIEEAFAVAAGEIELSESDIKARYEYEAARRDIDDYAREGDCGMIRLTRDAFLEGTDYGTREGDLAIVAYANIALNEVCR